MKIKTVLKNQSHRLQIKAIISKLTDDEVVTALEVHQKTGIPRRTIQDAFNVFFKSGELDREMISGKFYFGKKEAIKLLRAKIKERYGVI